MVISTPLSPEEIEKRLGKQKEPKETAAEKKAREKAEKEAKDE